MPHDPLSSSFAKRALALNDSRLSRLYSENEGLSSVKRTSSIEAFDRFNHLDAETSLSKELQGNSSEAHANTDSVTVPSDDIKKSHQVTGKNLSVKLAVDETEPLPDELALSPSEEELNKTQHAANEASESVQETSSHAISRKPSLKIGGSMTRQASANKKQTQSFGWLVGASLGVVGGPGWASKLHQDKEAEDEPMFKPTVLSRAPSQFPSTAPSSAGSSFTSAHPSARGMTSFLSVLKHASAGGGGKGSARSFLQGAARRITVKLKKKKFQKTLSSNEILSFASDRADYWMMKREFLPNRVRMKLVSKRVKGLVNRMSAADESKAAEERLRFLREKEERDMGVGKPSEPDVKMELRLGTLIKMKAFARTEVPSAESEHDYRVRKLPEFSSLFSC